MPEGHVTSEASQDQELRSDKTPPSSYEGPKNEARNSREGGVLERSNGRSPSCERSEPHTPPRSGAGDNPPSEARIGRRPWGLSTGSGESRSERSEPSQRKWGGLREGLAPPAGLGEASPGSEATILINERSELGFGAQPRTKAQPLVRSVATSEERSDE